MKWKSRIKKPAVCFWQLKNLPMSLFILRINVEHMNLRYETEISYFKFYEWELL